MIERTSNRFDLGANAGALAAAILFGASVVAVRVAVRDIPPTTLAVFRFGLGAIAMLGVAALLKPELIRVTRSSLRTAALLGVISFSLFPLTFNAGLQFIQASRGALMLATMPIWSMLLARWTIGEHLVPRQILGIAISISGVAIVVLEAGLVLESSGRALLGDALVMSTAFLGALYGVLAKRVLGREHPFTLVTFAMLFGTIVLLPIAFVEGLVTELGELDASLVSILLFLAIPGGAVAFGLWTASLARLSPTQVAVYINVNPIVAATLGVILLSERASPVFVVSFVAVIAGAVCVNWPVRERVRV